MAKVTERVVRNQFVKYLGLWIGMDNSQRGFMAICSKLSQLLIQHQHLLDILEAKELKGGLSSTK